MGEGEETRSSVQAAIEWDLDKFDATAICFCKRSDRRLQNIFVKGPIGDCKIFDNLCRAGGWSCGEVAVSCPVCCWVVHLVW